MVTLTHRPSDPLSSLGVHLFWSLEGDVQFEQEAILPKGFTEIVFNFTDTSDTVNYRLHTSNKYPKALSACGPKFIATK